MKGRRIMIQKVYSVYISPEGNTARSVTRLGNSLASRLGVICQTDDFTLPGSRQEARTYGEEDLVVFGTPTYAGRVPNKFLPFVKELFLGNGTPIIPVVTFGNRAYDSSLEELKETLEANGFQAIAAAAVCCEHSFAGTGKGRPDENDLQMLTKLAEGVTRCLREAEKVRRSRKETVCNRDEKSESLLLPEVHINGDEPAQPYYTPLKEDGTPAKFLKARPKTDRRKCSRCGQCALLCPMGSISFENTDEVPGSCIKCQACVKGCPQKAKYFDDPDFLSHKRYLQKNHRKYVKSEIFLPEM